MRASTMERVARASGKALRSSNSHSARTFALSSQSRLAAVGVDNSARFCKRSVHCHAQVGTVTAELVGLEFQPPAELAVVGETTAQFEDDYTSRHQAVLHYFPNALGIDDFVARAEIALCAFGFTGQNSIAMTNLCRDEITVMLKDKLEAVFGGSFNTNGLGGVLTCGVTGMGAGFSHSPVCGEQRERYVFFSFPHIAIDSTATLGSVYRPGRPGRSCACGALQKVLNELKTESVVANCKIPGEHDVADPEYTILKQRLARRIQKEGYDIADLDLADITHIAERQITYDLETLIDHSVDSKKADYAVITGVQIHNWAPEGSDSPHFEFVAPATAYIVVQGRRTDLDLMLLPVLPPRVISLLATKSDHQATKHEVVSDAARSPAGYGSTLSTIPDHYLAARIGAAFTGRA